MVHKRGEWVISYINTFQNAEALEVSVRNSYTKVQLMQKIGLFPEGGVYSAQISIHGEEFRREWPYVIQK